MAKFEDIRHTPSLFSRQYKILQFVLIIVAPVVLNATGI